MFDRNFSFEVSIQGDAVCVGGRGLTSTGKCAFVIRLEDIDFVVDDTLPLEWRPASYNPIKTSGESPLLRGMIGTWGTFTNPKTNNPAFLIYKHRDKCVTITLKQAQVLIFSNLAGLLKDWQNLTTPAVKEFSFEVDDKAATKNLIVTALIQQRSQT
jgi:hypothetical protein